MHFGVLVLNASYEAINICDVKRAIALIFKGVATSEEDSEYEIRSPNFIMKVPVVIRLLKYVHVPHRVVRFSRRNVMLRDRYSCQYCGKSFSSSALTLDHIVPLSRGGGTEWENVVTACKMCNVKKGNRTPHESGMYPLRIPKAPPIVLYLHLVKNLTGHHPTWQKYLFLEH
jgi:5-methylcytosine-specific restriction endonuclease McrA